MAFLNKIPITQYSLACSRFLQPNYNGPGLAYVLKRFPN